MDEPEPAGEPFNFIGNRVCLDFANTLHDRFSSAPRDHFKTYADLVWWSQAADILQPGEAQRLFEEAKRHPTKMALVLQDAIALRETLYRIFSGLARGAMLEAVDLQKLNIAYGEAMGRVCIVQDGNDFVGDWNGKETALQRMVWDIVRSAAELLVSTDLHLLRECAAEDCGWLFLDTSKNHSRRWCDMKSCGNRAKVGKHYQQIKMKHV